MSGFAEATFTVRGQYRKKVLPVTAKLSGKHYEDSETRSPTSYLFHPMRTKSAPATPGYTRELLLDFLPFVLLVLLTWAKVSYFNLPPRTYIDNDWYSWYREEALRAVSDPWQHCWSRSRRCCLDRSRQFMAAWLANFIVSLIVVADVLHFRFYGDIISLASAADTVCVTPNASVTTAKCRDTRTGEVLDPARFSVRFDQARKRLEISDIMIMRNLIPPLAAQR